MMAVIDVRERRVDVLGSLGYPVGLRVTAAGTPTPSIDVDAVDARVLDAYGNTVAQFAKTVDGATLDLVLSGLQTAGIGTVNGRWYLAVGDRPWAGGGFDLSSLAVVPSVSPWSPPVTHDLGDLTVTVAPLTEFGPVPQLFPTALSSGLPSGWVPAQTVTGNVQHSTPGQVFEDVLFDGSLMPNGASVVQAVADDVVYRNCLFRNAYTDSYIYFPEPQRPARNVRYENCLSEKSTSNVGPGRQFTAFNINDGAVVGCKVVGWPRGFSVGATDAVPCELLVQDTFIDIDLTGIAGDVFHGEAFQFTGGNSLVTLEWVTALVPSFNDVDSATGGVFSQSHNAGAMTISHLLTSGGIWPLRLEAMPPVMSATDVYVIEGSYSGEAVSFASPPDAFSGWLCTLDGAGQPVRGAAIVP